MKYDPDREKRIAEAFEKAGDALIHVLAAAQKSDWQLQHRASEEFGQAAAGVYRAIADEGVPTDAGA